ncbi:GUN4 domain-containing protein, partial [Okeania sp. SIO2B9]|uniref:GUN4 domain-containing protein n=1 Tax=Okeania sp. SIO2B9 TaxID=2607782 RepID=UPI00257E5790
PYVIAMTEFLTHKDTKPPLTISIEGEWGSGKSSFMKQLESEVKKKSKELDREESKKVWQKIKKDRIIFSDVSDIYELFRLKFKQETQTVWFNAWRHDKSESLWATFALSFLEQLSNNRNLSDFVINSGDALRLFFYRLNFKGKPLKAIQTLMIVLLIIGIILAIPVVSWNVGVKRIPQWSEILAGLVKTEDSKKEDENQIIDNQETNNEKDKNDNQDSKLTDQENTQNSLINDLFKFVFGFSFGTGSFAAIRKLMGTIKDLIGDPKMDLTQYLEHPDYEKQVAFIEKFHEDFSKIVNAYVGENEKIYVFIDDIDRCELDKSADLLQALNMMISNDPKIIFILGMDREKVAAAISFKQKDVIPFLASAIAENEAEENESQKLSKKVDYGFSFLEKFVQLSFSVPAPSLKTLDSFVEKILEIKTSSEKQEKRFFWIPHSLIAKVFDLPARFNDGKEWIEKFKDRIFSSKEKEGEKTEAEESSVSEQNSESQEAETSSLDLPIFPIIEKDLDSESLAQVIEMVAPFFDYNPRRIKQYINVLRLRIYIAYYSIGVTFAERETITVEQIGKFTAITLRYPRLLLELKNNYQLLAELEKDAVDKSILSTNSIILSPESTPSDRETGNANYWLKNYPKIQQLLCSEMTLDNEQKSGKKYIFENGSIKKLLEVSPQQSLSSKYFKLREFLAAQKWREADEETYEVILQVAGPEKEGWLRVEDIEKFPCEDLRIIDQLWVKYSLGKFGFSVQKKIYQSLGGRREYNREVWEKFGKEVGWCINESWEKVNYDKISDESGLIVVAYRGYLPFESFGQIDIGEVPKGYFGVLFSRAETCRL